MADPREQGIHPLQQEFNEWNATEYPKLQTFRQRLYESSVMLRQGQMSEGDFFRGLMGQDYSGEVSFKVRWEQALPELEMDFIIQKTPDKKLKVTRPEEDYSAFSIPRFTATIGLSEEEKMQVEQVEAAGFNEETGEFEVYEDDGFLISDVITANGAATTTREEQGVMLKEALFRVFLSFY